MHLIKGNSGGKSGSLTRYPLTKLNARGMTQHTTHPRRIKDSNPSTDFVIIKTSGHQQ